MLSIKPQSKPRVNVWGDDHPEKINNTSGIAGFSDQLKGLVNPTSMLDQLFGVKKSGEFSRKPHGTEKKIPYQHETIVFSLASREEDQKIQQETAELVQQLKQQITRLEKTEKSLTSDIAKVKVEQLPPKAGIYFLRYIEWLIAEVKRLTEKADSAGRWLANFQIRQKKRLGYWQKYKKHGTTFGLSHERTLATQTG